MVFSISSPKLGIPNRFLELYPDRKFNPKYFDVLIASRKTFKTYGCWSLIPNFMG